MKKGILLQKQNVWKRCLLVGMLSILSMFGALAQELTVNGTVTAEEDGQGIPGVSIIIKGTGSGTITDIDGNYSLKTNIGDVLRYSFIGMVTAELEVAGTTMNLAMEADMQELDEVVVIGYGTQKKKEVTGAVVHVKAEQINEVLTSDLGTALQGRIAGVNVVASSGEPGAASNILIRGVTSIDGSNTPLFVVDGIPQDGDPRIPNNEIESVDVLKDAASAAIYGTRGAAGVILITTKTGKAGETKVNYTTTYGVNKITSGVPLMNTNETLYFIQNLDKYSPSVGGNDIEKNPAWLLNETDITDLVQNDQTLTKTHNMSVSGGLKDFSYSANFGYYDQEGVIVNSFLKRYNGRLSTAYRGDKLSIRTSLAFTHENNDRTSDGLLTWAMRYEPFQPDVSSADQELEFAGGPSETKLDNLLQRLKNENNRKRDRFNGSLDINYEIIKGLTIGSNIGVGVQNILDEGFTPPYAKLDVNTGEYEVDPTKSFIEMNSVRQVNWAWTGLTQYTKEIGLHKFTGLASITIDERTREDFSAFRAGITDPDISVLNVGTINEQAFSGFNYTIRNFGLIGRLQYDYRSKYLLSASIRRDASSKFGEANRWGTFPSLSAGWNVSEESFWTPLSSVVSSMKVRASYGTTGNENFDPYRYSPIIEFGTDYLFGPGLSFGGSQKSYANASVKWETSVQNNLGVDLALFDGRLLVNADYYNTKKKDMLFPVRLAPSNGVPGSEGNNPSNPDVTLNVGNMTNSGLELAATYRILKGELSLDFGLVYARNENKITKINGESNVIFNSGGTTIAGDGASQVSVTAVGYEAGSFFLHKTNGVIKNEEQLAAYQKMVPSAQMGDLLYVDVNGDSTIDVKDQVYAGSGLPDYEIGFNTNAKYKGFDFVMQWYASVGHEVINGSSAFSHSYARNRNLLNMWTPANPEAELPIYRGNSKDHPNYAGTTDLWLEDGTYLRLRVVSLGYTLPKSFLSRVGIDKLRVYASAQNPITITNYKGYDPEVGGNNVNQRGLDTGIYPVSAMYLMGIEVGF